MSEKKIILDACCSARSMWFNKNHPDTLYMDIRKENLIVAGKKWNVYPDVVADFRNMPFEDNSFKLVVFDPPHIKNITENAIMAQKYGRLFSSWEIDLKAGFDECMRVLEPYGILIFKWNEANIKVSKILEVLKCQPLFGHPTNKNGTTHWFCFMKLPTKDNS
ncbi:methyltransferase [Bacteroides nordii]|uniref:methyltransferase n=1 Tax=Bacteroides nordii TaxID=291645 RepID=UPI0034A2963A